MEYSSNSYSWFEQISKKFGVSATGYILIDSRSGMCLDARGNAKQEDALRLHAASGSAGILDQSGNGAVMYKNERILLRKEDNCLVGVYTTEMEM
ncbi:uncharacterized protein V1516DRAFT_676503, partial [Lipomyces oligophaga]|uniref:uncharacterized protein n=1 Tax=Lipomyces oligophaga TaxID=45792 RepID=UPI0034CD4D7F